MSDIPFDSLSVRQLECLRLVGRGFNTKEIAAELSISPETARSHIDAARAKLGVSHRSKAARLLADYEAQEPPPRTGTPFPGMATGRTLPHEDGVSVEEVEVRTILHDAAVPTYQATSGPAAQFRWPFRTTGRPFSDLAWFEQVGWAVAIAIGSIVAVHELISILAG